ncbi:MAG: glycosyltransferase family 2 protein [Lachnospiraceae bacterium]|nr:glycosyltransferase family 2 protein [Lachnospiraceae bacterium]
MDATIVIPTKNAGDILNRTLGMVFSQKTQFTYEVICVDSGSKDNTLEIIKQYPCILYEIPAQEFGHGKTRNYGASQGKGEFIVFITQDAAPAKEDWLEQLILAVKSDDQIAGGFGIHYPYEDCNALDRVDLVRHFQNYGMENTIFYIDDMEKFKNDNAYMQHLAFFSDNNSCIRRAVWQQYPYPDVNFAEDQIWMRKMMEKGYKKVYCPKAPVYHSHNFKLSTYYKRFFDEYRGLYDVYGYIISDSWWSLPIHWAKHIRRDLANIRSQQMSRSRKLYWLGYSIIRNYCRYYGGYKGGMWHSFSPARQQRIDRRFSQQYKEKRA